MTTGKQNSTLEELFEIESETLKIARKHKEKIRSLLQSLAEYHIPTYEHSIRVGLASSHIARFMNLNPKTAFYGVLHDIGKRRIPIEVLSKTEGFSAQDLEIMKYHVIAGHEILMAEGYTFSAWLALTHHYYQKNSYPKELPLKPEMFSHGSNLLLDMYSRIVSIADHNDALKRRNDKFGSPEMKIKRAREIMFETNPDQKDLIEHLYNGGVLI